jgi:catechol 2,3-dioxygenase-like lactoylglutathione lyase family enzyme
MAMQQQISVITLGIENLDQSRRFYQHGFGWKPVFENADISFYQMNGFVLGTWLKGALLDDMQRPAITGASAISLAHNVANEDQVRNLMDRLRANGGTVLRPADAPPYGGLRGYVADPDGHAWEIAWNPAWAIDANGHVTFGV